MVKLFEISKDNKRLKEKEKNNIEKSNIEDSDSDIDKKNNYRYKN